MTEEKAIKILEQTKRNCGLPEQGDTWKPNAETIALDMAINALEKQKDNGWIPCSERLPEEYGDYLVWWTDITSKQYYEIAEYEPNNGWVGEIPQAVEGKYSVIAWQPLPVPYKEANNDRY